MKILERQACVPLYLHIQEVADALTGEADPYDLLVKAEAVEARPEKLTRGECAAAALLWAASRRYDKTWRWRASLRTVQQSNALACRGSEAGRQTTSRLSHTPWIRCSSRTGYAEDGARPGILHGKRMGQRCRLVE